MAYSDQYLDYFAAVGNFKDLNPDKHKYGNYASQYRCKAKKERDPEKRKRLLKKAEEYQKKADAIPSVTTKSLGMPRIPKSYFKY